MKRVLSICMALLLTALLFCTTLTAYAAGASVTISANNLKPTVGSTVKVTVKYTAPSTIGSVDASLKYDAKVLEYVSASGITANGGAGVIKLSYFETASSASKTKSFTLTFKAKATGTCALSLSTAEIADWETYESLGTPSGKVTVSVQNPQKSSNANLSELYISSGALSPKFSPSVTSYNIVIPNNVTVLTVSAETEDKDATVVVEGSKNMKVGKNTRVIIVTAPNGATKSYTLNITRQEVSGNDIPPKGEEDDKNPQKDEQAAKVTVGEETLYIASDLKDVKLPTGYEQVKITVNDVEFPSVQDKSRSIVLLYLTDEEGKGGAFYVYDTVSMTFSEFCSVKVKAGVYVFLTPEGDVSIPEGFTQSFVEIGSKTVAAWTFPEEELKEYYLVYALSPGGIKGLYQYDTIEETFQRYTHVERAPVTEQLPTEGVEGQEGENSGFLAQVKGFFEGLIARFGMTQFILMVVGILILIVAIVILIVLLAKRPKNYRH